jgi:hypothetical protein
VTEEIAKNSRFNLKTLQIASTFFAKFVNPLNGLGIFHGRRNNRRHADTSGHCTHARRHRVRVETAP